MDLSLPARKGDSPFSRRSTILHGYDYRAAKIGTVPSRPQPRNHSTVSALLQSATVRGGGTGQAVEIITAFQNRDYAALACWRAISSTKPVKSR